jgi:hypothetical protein
LRWALFEAAHQSARRGSPDHDYYLQVAGRIDHNRACLSVARKDMWRLVPRGHQVDQADRALGGLEVGLQHERVAAINVGEPPAQARVGRSASGRSPRRRGGRRSRLPSRSVAGRASRSSRRGRRARPCACRPAVRSPRSVTASESSPRKRPRQLGLRRAGAGRLARPPLLRLRALPRPEGSGARALRRRRRGRPRREGRSPSPG